MFSATRANGITRYGLWNLCHQAISYFRFHPLEEQKQIAAFLDKETTNIDTLIDKQEQLITLLQRKAAGDHFTCRYQRVEPGCEYERQWD